MSNIWRLAFMFDARGGDLMAMEQALARNAHLIRRRAGQAHVRLGVADRHPALGAATQTEYAVDQWRTVDGAIELTITAQQAPELAQASASLRDIIEPLSEPGSVEVMTGPMFSMVPPLAGDTFLSLAFARDPAITSAQFRNWWRDQHAGVAIPVLGPGMLAYDQVHVDAAASEAVALAFGVEPVVYDAYDNLTWADRDAYLTSISNAEAMAGIFADEIGHIDNRTRRHALMHRITGDA